MEMTCTSLDTYQSNDMNAYWRIGNDTYGLW